MMIIFFQKVWISSDTRPQYRKYDLQNLFSSCENTNEIYYNAAEPNPSIRRAPKFVKGYEHIHFFIFFLRPFFRMVVGWLHIPPCINQKSLGRHELLAA